MTNFDLQAQGLSMANALLLGQAANAAYQDKASCQQWAQQNGFNGDFDFFTKEAPLTDTNGFVAQNAAAVLVAFRGTDPQRPVDWFTDLSAFREQAIFPNAKVHQGFDRALDAVWDQVSQRLTGRGTRAVWFTGHSLGGALAELAAARAVQAGIPVQGVYTFGQPRVGDKTFALAMEARLGAQIFRFIHNRDIVPRVPPFSAGYRHYGSEIFFDAKNQQENRPADVETLLGALRLAALGVNLDLVKEVAELTLAEVIHDDAVEKRELELLGNFKDVLRAGTENIADHSMVNGYLPRLTAALAAAV